jgi:O-antigen ligase
MAGTSVVSMATGASNRAVTRLDIHPVVIIQAAIFMIVVGNLGRIPFLDLGERSAPIIVNDLCVMAAIVAGGLVVLRDRSLRLSDTAIAGLVFASLGALTAVAGIQRFGFSAMEVMGSLAYLARWLLYFSLYIAIVNCVKAVDVERLWRTLEWAMILIVAFGVIQSIFLPNFAFMVYPDARHGLDWDAQKNRLVSTILEPNIVAAMIMMTLLVQLARLASGAREPLWKPVLLFAGLAMTLSRGGMFSFAVGCLALLPVIALSKRVMRLAVVLLVLLAAALPKFIAFAAQYARFGLSDQSALDRVVVWQRAIDTFLDYPILGIGFNTWAFVQERRGFERISVSSYSAEGGLLFVAVLTGLIGLAVFVAMLWFVLRRCLSSARQRAASPAERGLLYGTFAATIALIVNSVFANSLMTIWTMEPLFVLWGLAFVAAIDVKRRSAAGVPAA